MVFQLANRSVRQVDSENETYFDQPFLRGEHLVTLAPTVQPYLIIETTCELVNRQGEGVIAAISADSHVAGQVPAGVIVLAAKRSYQYSVRETYLKRNF